MVVARAERDKYVSAQISIHVRLVHEYTRIATTISRNKCNVQVMGFVVDRCLISCLKQRYLPLVDGNQRKRGRGHARRPSIEIAGRTKIGRASCRERV